MTTSTVTPPALSYLATLATIRATAMGLLEVTAFASTSTPGYVERFLERAQEAGIGRGLMLPAGGIEDRDAVADLWGDLLEAMAASPVPEYEWGAVERVLGPDVLSNLLGISPSSLRRYASGSRPTPDPVAAKLHFLALIVGDLAGSYNDRGVRLWFERKRAQLGNEAPAQILSSGDWDPDGDGPARVRALAATLVEGPGA